jgi:hypothetical protein
MNEKIKTKILDYTVLLNSSVSIKQSERLEFYNFIDENYKSKENNNFAGAFIRALVINISLFDNKTNYHTNIFFKEKDLNKIYIDFLKLNLKINAKIKYF